MLRVMRRGGGSITPLHADHDAALTGSVWPHGSLHCPCCGGNHRQRASLHRPLVRVRLPR